MSSGSTRQTTQVGANKRNNYTGGGPNHDSAKSGYDFFLSYPLKRAPKGNEDSFLIQSITYVPSEKDRVKMNTGTNISYKTETVDGKEEYVIDKENSGANIGIYDKDFKGALSGFKMSGGGGPAKALNSHTGDGASSFSHLTNFYVELPIPKQVQDGNAVQWGANSMNLFTLAGMDLAANIMKDPKSTIGDIQTIYSNLVQNQNLGKGGLGIDGEELQNSIRASLAGAAVNVFGANVTPNSVMSRAMGKILNGNKELLFDGVTLREFKFDFTFTPRSSAEGERARKIIRQLKRSMAPKAGGDYKAGGFGSGGGVFLNSPDLFLLRYLSGSYDHPFLNSFKPCALTGLSVNYTGGGTYATYGTGRPGGESTPVHMKISMTFKETNPVYNEDYVNENIRGVGF